MSRMEELQNAIVPINLVVFVSFLISVGAVQDPDSTIAKIASLLPFSSALAMPVRMVLGSATPWEIVGIARDRDRLHRAADPTRGPRLRGARSSAPERR